MVSTYFLMKSFQRATIERKRTCESNDKSLEIGEFNSTDIYKCRICLKQGRIPIYDGNESSELSENICEFGKILIEEDDKYPKHICSSCYKLLECAILFRKIAKKSECILRNYSDSEYVSDKFNEEQQLSNTQLHNVQDDKVSISHSYTINETKNSQSLIYKYFSTLSDYDEQINGHDNSKAIKVKKKRSNKVQCQICHKIITKAYYKEHFALHDPTISKYMCDICGKSFRQRCSYRNHYFTHSTEFPFRCKICLYRGRTSSLLKIHMRTHSSDYRYMCSECPSRFLTKSNLNKHLLTHKEPTFKCNACVKTFHTKLAQERHFEVDHLGIKNHTCDMCGKAFGYRKAMMRHQLDVHKRVKKLNGRTPAYIEAEIKPMDSNIENVSFENFSL